MMTLWKNLLSKRSRKERAGHAVKGRSLRLESLEQRDLLAVSPLGVEPQPNTAVVSAADLDGDGMVGPGDYSLLSSHWLVSADEENWNPSYDIDADGVIGPGDLTYIRANWMKSVGDPDFVNPPGAAVLSVGSTDTVPLPEDGGVPQDTALDDPEVTITLAALSEPTENYQVLATGSRNFGTFYYLPNDEVPVSTREAVVGSNEFYLEVWVSDFNANGKFISSIQIQLDYDPDQVVFLDLEDIYAGKVTMSEYLYYDTGQTRIKGVQVAWLFSSTQDWSLLQPITGGENSWLLARFVVSLDSSSQTTPSISVSGITDPVSPFVYGYYYVRSGETYPLADALIESVGVPSYSRLWAHTPDIDGNGIVSTGDWGLLLSAWHTAPGDVAWNEDCDINGDDYVDNADLTWLVDYWFTTLS